jgi:DNA (cytosine-5)-methyltransferase 1
MDRLQLDHAPELVLSLYPGIDVLGRGFYAEDFCVVKGPDLLWDERIEDFRGLRYRFDGVIGGPPCQNYSDANRHRNEAEGDRLIGEFLRVVLECMPHWFLMENVRNVPDVYLPPYHVQRFDLTDHACGGVQWRLRHVQFGSLAGTIIRPERTKADRPVTGRPTVTCRPRSQHDRPCRRAAAQGVEDLSLSSLTRTAKARAVGNAVSLRMAFVLAAAVSQRSYPTHRDCVCGCGRRITPPAAHATVSCRKRMERRRRGLTRAVTFADRGVTAWPGHVEGIRSWPSYSGMG